MRVGDVILSINHEAYSTPADATRAVDLASTTLEFEVSRGGAREVTITKMRNNVRPSPASTLAHSHTNLCASAMPLSRTAPV